MFISFNNFILQEEQRERDFQLVIVNLEHKFFSVVWSHCLTHLCNQDGLIISIDVTLITNIKKTCPFAVLKLIFFKNETNQINNKSVHIVNSIHFPAEQNLLEETNILSIIKKGI